MVNINNIIKVDFNVSSQTGQVGAYSTVVYVVSPLSGGGSKLKDTSTVSIDTNVAFNYKLCSSIDSIEDCFISSGADIEICSAYNFFLNGGCRLLLVEVASTTEAESFDMLFRKLRELPSDKGSDFMYVCLSSSTVLALGKTKLNAVVMAAEASKSPYTYRILLTSYKDGSTYKEYPVDTDTYKNSYSVGVKYCTKTIASDATQRVVDAALLIGAYYSQVDLNGSETIKDYCYTSETLDNYFQESTDRDFDSGKEDVTDAQYNTLIDNNCNFIDEIGKRIVNFGGNLKNGVSIHTDFGVTAAENDVTNAVLSCMLNKQYLTVAGLNTVIASIDAALVRYMSNGLLESGSLYDGEDITRLYNGVQYTIIKKGTSLSKGYLVTAIPMANISEQDKADKRFTPIYVIMQTQSGARVIEITGEVR